MALKKKTVDELLASRTRVDKAEGGLRRAQRSSPADRKRALAEYVEAKREERKLLERAERELG